MSETVEESGADALLEGLIGSGVEVIFANLGSDHPAIIESLARRRQRGDPTPAVVLAPHEASALSAAHGFTLASGRPQAVLVHVDVGTANLGGAVHNAARARVPVIIVAGLTPFTLEGELPGGRNSYPNHLQDVDDQPSLVRPYVKWSYDLRTPANTRQIVARAVQIAESAPAGPVYLTAAREVLAATSRSRVLDGAKWRPVEPAPMPSELAREIVEAITQARFPILITSSLGRSTVAMQTLVRLSDRLGLGVVEAVPQALNFPSDHLHHLGYSAERLLDRADVVLVMDCDAPWIPLRGGPREDCRVFVIDSDPLKERIPLWYLESERHARADSSVALSQLWEHSGSVGELGPVERRHRAISGEHALMRAEWQVQAEGADQLTVAGICEALARTIDDSTVVLNEAISNAETDFRHLPRSFPGTRFASGGSSLGWSSGAAVGMKLARPDERVVAVVGDGSFFLSEPPSAFWMARQYDAPFLTVILDNGGWNATTQNVLRQHPSGSVSASGRYWVGLDQTADLPEVAKAAGAAYAATATTVVEFDRMVAEAWEVLQQGGAAVIAAQLSRISTQQPDVLKELGGFDDAKA